MSDTGATGHAWPCTRFYVTASDRDRCTCPVSDTGAVERAAREEAERRWRTGEQGPVVGWVGGYVEGYRAALAAAAPTVEQVAEVLGEVLWRRQSDVLERRAFAFSDAPSRMHYLAHGRALAEQAAALWGAR